MQQAADQFTGLLIKIYESFIQIRIGAGKTAEGIIYGNWITPVTSIPGNLLQIGTAAVIVLIIIAPLKKVAAKLWN